MGIILKAKHPYYSPSFLANRNRTKALTLMLLNYLESCYGGETGFRGLSAQRIAELAELPLQTIKNKAPLWFKWKLLTRTTTVYELTGLPMYLYKISDYGRSWLNNVPDSLMLQFVLLVPKIDEKLKW